MRISTRLAMFGCAVAMALTACGGASPNGFLEAAGDAVSSSDEGITANFGDAEVSYGNNDRPGWLPSEFLWPDGIESQYAINDTSTGEQAYLGLVRDGDVASLRAEQHGALLAAGYELLGDSSIFISPDGQAIEMDVEESEVGGVMLQMSRRSEDLQTLRDVYAPIEGQGTMAVQIDGDNLLFTGPCSLRSSSGQFTAESDDPAADRGSITVEIRENEQNYILADVTTISDETFAAWNMVQVDEAGDFPTIAMTGSGFTVDGFMGDFSGGPATPVQITVTCPA